MAEQKPGLALLGAGIFACSQYVPTFRAITDVATLRVVWSRSQEVAMEGALLCKDFSPDVQAKWGEEGLEEIFADQSIHGVTVVLPAQVQLGIVIRSLKAGKHVLQEKPVGTSVAELRGALQQYYEIATSGVQPPIWAVAENYRFEPSLMEAAKWVKEAGSVYSVQVTAEAAMNSTNPYFSSAWRRDPGLKGAFVLDGGVHFVAGLRLICGAEVTSTSAIAQHLEPNLPPPDNVSALFQMDNGCTGTLVMSFSAVTKKINWRVLCSKGTVDVERSVQDGKHGYLVQYFPQEGKAKKFFAAFSGVQDEIKAFALDVSKVVSGVKTASEADPRSSVSEAVFDVAVVEAFLRSSDAKGSLVSVELV
ncbi:hypothetical protein MPTK1_4g04870 [Marchantia polymorpha subsp. ruderalis]|uniref:Gfo/Idh/MocA-like oxidoreductase N-terminal domain-containing protein n=2 Tax=Marchantia polymorpha TaxID=3197 RepID=A0AAF6B6G2_MARPO|nr:hypothetical protein MARPO_0150s0011 [Marchantia polymorpha]BBN07596.1 hypothetical protein Mp_4g04870 [Marchantia polymorpha subsp. ruderalis]|eukprot:PTQ28988.1 hypothetical protein MARPO_0150s0011 [Marchantia polymorpha]